MTLRAGRYELLDTIASGGMATVHLGRAVGAGGFERLVAIKTMHPHLSNEPDFVAMFLDEARLAARIRHPNVVGSIDIQQDERGLLLVMEFIEGPAMSQILRALNKKKVSLPLDIALRIILDVLAGLHAAHELCGAEGEPLNVVHRDISPQNILVGVDGIARIMDFGIARAESRISQTKAGDAKGKIAYMAPEQALQKDMDRRVDVYAAGLVFWEFLVGRRLLRGDNDMVIMHQIFHGQHQAPHEIVESVPPELSEIAMRAIDRDRDVRYPTTAAFAEAIENAVRSLGLKVATPQTLGAFVRELNLHKSPNEIISVSRPVPVPASIRTLPSVTSAAISVPTSSVPQVDIATPSTSTESRGAFSATPPVSARATKSTKTTILLSAGAVVLLGAGVWFVLNTTGAKDPEPTTANAVPETRSSMETPPAAVPSAASVATASASAAASSASSAAEPASGSKTSPRVSPVNTGGSKTPKTFIPKEL